MKRVKDADHGNRLRQLSCLRCGARDGLQAAHIRRTCLRLGKRNPGIGQKPHDWFMVPLCFRCHEMQHKVGETNFWPDVFEALAVAQALYLAEDHEAREQIIEANRHA